MSIKGVWKINGNGHEGELNIASVDAQGRLRGKAFNNEILGFWDDTSKKVTFMRLCNPADPSTYQIYTGYQFQTPINPGAGENYTLTLTGSFEAFAGTGGMPRRNLYGWFANVQVVG